jgi:hypothetical protein
MIKLEKDGVKMGARNDIQASAFIKNGWIVIEEGTESTSESNTPKEAPKRGRKPKTE